MGHDHSHSRGAPNDLGPVPVPNYGSIHREELEEAGGQTNGEVGGTLRANEPLRHALEVVTVAQDDIEKNRVRISNDVAFGVRANVVQPGHAGDGFSGCGEASTLPLSSSFRDKVRKNSMNKPIGTDPSNLNATVSDSDDEDRMTTVSMHGDPGSHSAFRAIVMVFALSLHSIFEGMAIGLQATTQQVVQLFGAIVVHKCVIAVTLGTNLVSSSTRLTHCTIFSCLAVFASMAPIGIGIAIGLDNAPEMVNGVLQCVAAGTFVYITFFEVLPHELNSKHTEGSRIFKIFMLLSGISLIIGIMILFPDQD
ncbi:zinc transporter ZIP1-like [Tropilaelaps mercedesae]|uniref:Zinc transporter ZIP1-like n=1 Tax=Tropilaelaps mercedesae TaxID=418985 RepID=A0A1V9Y123_9ACAR|nr:zinc transporter ZIP1-like [Tropilaelaps mercedesae]